MLHSVEMNPNHLVIADHYVHSGFARVAEAICARLKSDWDISVMAFNFAGQPTHYGYDVFPARLYGDELTTFKKVTAEVKPDIIFVLADPWVTAEFVYLAKNEDNKGTIGKIPMVAYMPVDAKNQNRNVCAVLNKLDLSIFYTRFGLLQCSLAGFAGKSCIIPHGVDTALYRPLDKAECRKNAGLNLPKYPTHKDICKGAKRSVFDNKLLHESISRLSDVKA